MNIYCKSRGKKEIEVNQIFISLLATSFKSMFSGQRLKIKVNNKQLYYSINSPIYFAENRKSKAMLDKQRFYWLIDNKQFCIDLLS